MNEVPKMDTHDRNLALMIFMAAVLVSVNFFAVITGVADGYYAKITELLQPLLLNHGCYADVVFSENRHHLRHGTRLIFQAEPYIASLEDVFS